MLNSKDIGLLRSDVAANCRLWQEQCKEVGLNVLITNTVRDKEYQEYLYAQGRTRPGSIVTNGRTPTFHSDKAGLAWDFCKNVKGHEYDDSAFFRKAAAIAKEMGFSWGGDWRSFPDSPHIQWDNHGQWTSSMILAGKFPPIMPLYEKEDGLNMTTQEFIESLTDEQAYSLLTKAQRHAGTLSEPKWSIDEGHWGKATTSGVINGKSPEGFIKRDEVIAILGRKGLV